MKIILTGIFLMLCSFTAFAQNNTTQELKELSDEESFDKIIKDYTSDISTYSAKELYYIAEAYFMTDDDENSLKFINMSIEKDDTDAQAHYIKGFTLIYMSRFDEAVVHYERAIELDPTKAKFYSGAGDAYYMAKHTDMALDKYKKAIELPDAYDRQYYMIAQIYMEKSDIEESVKALKHARECIPKESDLYTNTLFNLGMYESKNGNYENAEKVFLELIELNPTDYHAHAKLIQTYFAKQEYDKAKPHRDLLYDAHKNKKLEEVMADMFCFDQFKWKDKAIRVFERYQDGPSKRIFYKHIFYILNETNEIEFTIQTEYSPAAISSGEGKYILCADKEGTHINYGLVFDDDMKYENLKKTVILMLEKTEE